MDMTPEQLFELVEPQRAAGQLEATHVDRCRVHGCHLVGFYRLRDQSVVIATPFKLSPAKSEKYGLPRRNPGRAWLGTKLPQGTVFACDHEVCTEA